MDHRNSKTRNLVKSLFLDPTELNNNNLVLKAKYEKMQREEVRWESYSADDDYEYEALIVSYGTMSRVCRTAIDNMQAEGLKVAMVRPQTLFPFPEQAVYNAATRQSCRVVLSIEMSMGQMVEDVQRSVKGQREVQWYGKCGGEVPTPEEVAEVVKGALKAL
jgi:2-oxoglutarate ferredoxin oxidoreductase subunit alpha